MKKLLMMATLAALASSPLRAQEQEKMTVPFRNPNMPRQVVVEGMVASVEITGYNGQEAIIESTGATAPRKKEVPVPPGMRRIGGSSMGLEVREENNVMRISTGVWSGKMALKIQVPTQTSVRVYTMSGQVRIENLNGEIEVQSVRGVVDILNASGSVVANSVGGKLTVSLNSVTPDKPMSFSTMNGDIDVTLPTSLKANLKMKTQQGDIFTDFDAQITPQEGSSRVSGNRVARNRDSDRPITATINGGGPEIQFTSFRGNILIHKK